MSTREIRPAKVMWRENPGGRPLARLTETKGFESVAHGCEWLGIHNDDRYGLRLDGAEVALPLRLQWVGRAMDAA